MPLSEGIRTVRDRLAELVALRQTNRLLRLDFPRNDGPAGAMLVANRLHAVESLSRDYVYTVEAISDRPDIVLADVLGRMVTVSLVRDDGSVRYFNGYVFSFQFIRNDGGFCFYEMTLMPWLACLRHRRNCSLFSETSIKTQLLEILARYPEADWKTSKLGDDPRMSDACQFDESDYNYIHRRIESMGWLYRYMHRHDGHTLHLTGDSYDCPPIDGRGSIEWHGAQSGVKTGGLREFRSRQSLTPTKFSAASFGFKNCGVPIASSYSENNIGQSGELEVYEYAGEYGFADRAAGDAFACLRIEETDARALTFHGAGDDDHVEPGRFFRVRDAGNLAGLGMSSESEFVVLEIVHTASNNYEVSASSDTDRRSEYRNTFTCISRKTAWRPGRGFNSIDTKIHGVQSATVIGIGDAEIYTDEYGRVLVEYHWSRNGDHAKLTGWVRVASGAAGPAYGHSFIPRAGDEVLIQHQDGNPDRPVITGRLFNGVNRPTRFNGRGRLPHDRNLSGLKSKEVKGGGYNQLRLDDTPEQVSAQVLSSHAQSQLNLGFLSHPREDGWGKHRGNGVELTTNASTAIRAAKGLLVSAWERLDACGNQLSCEEHVALMQVCLDLFKTIGKASAENNAGVVDDGPQADLGSAVKAWGTQAQATAAAEPAPALVITGPDGLSFATPKALVSYSGLNIDSVAHRKIQLTAGSDLVANASQGISLFAQRNGIRQVAHYGKFVLQSQHDDIALNAAKNAVMTATDGVIKLMAKEIQLITEDGSFIKLGGGMTAGSNSGMHFKAPSFDYGSSATMHAELPYFADEGKAPPHWIALQYLDAETSERLSGAEYEIHFENGPMISGTLDEQGTARHENVLERPVSKIEYKPRSPDEDEPTPSFEQVLS